MTRTSTKSGESLQPLMSEVQENAGPLLGGASEIEQSPLERLIQQSTSEQVAAASSSFFIEEADSTPRRGTEAPAAPPVSSVFRTTVVTLAAGTLCLLQTGLVWASFLSNEWFETHVTITIGNTWGKRAGMHNFEFSTDQTLQKTTLASLLSMLLGAGQDWPAMILVLTCLICPCLCMILCPSWTVEDYQEAIRPSPRRQAVTSPARDLLGFNPRVIAEHFLVRICFLAFFLLAILDVGTSSLALENNHSEFLVTNRTKGGVVCYCLGMSCALGVVVLLRMASHPSYQPPPGTPIGAASRSAGRYTQQDHPRAPPDQAFRELQRPLLTDEEDAELVESGASQAATSPALTGYESGLSYWKRIVIYEFGILATVLWIPALFLPLFQINFDGLVASFMEEVSFEVPFYQLPTVLLERSTAGGTDQWALLSLGIVLLLLVYILPLVATVSAISAWRSPDHSKAAWFFKAILRSLQPCLCGFVFSLSLLLAVPTFEPLGDYLLDTQTSGFCQRFENVTDTSCLIIHGQHRLGQWFLLAQSVSLEIFVLLTLLWKR
jgi:hypothetical protein